MFLMIAALEVVGYLKFWPIPVVIAAVNIFLIFIIPEADPLFKIVRFGGTFVFTIPVIILFLWVYWKTKSGKALGFASGLILLSIGGAFSRVPDIGFNLFGTFNLLSMFMILAGLFGMLDDILPSRQTPIDVPKRSLLYGEVFGFVFIYLAGSVIHFLYEWTKFLPVALIAPVNESVWEHSKLGVIGAVLFLFVQYVLMKTQNKSPNLLLATASSLYVFPTVMVTCFYLWLNLTGGFNLASNLTIFGIAIIVSLIVKYIILVGHSYNAEYVGLLAILVIIVIIGVLTFFPFDWPMFQDPQSGIIGIPN